MAEYAPNSTKLNIFLLGDIPKYAYKEVTEIEGMSETHLFVNGDYVYGRRLVNHQILECFFIKSLQFFPECIGDIVVGYSQDLWQEDIREAIYRERKHLNRLKMNITDSLVVYHARRCLEIWYLNEFNVEFDDFTLLGLISGESEESCNSDSNGV